MRPYHRPTPHRFWLKRRPYVLFIVRELTSLFTAGFCLFLLVFIYKLGEGPEAYNGMIALLKSPFVIVVHWIVLIFALYHTFTWFNLTPKAMVFWIGERRIPGSVILAAIYTGWIGVSVVITWLIVGI